jgi:hypothetical protein
MVKHSAELKSLADRRVLHLERHIDLRDGQHLQHTSLTGALLRRGQS